MALIASSMGIQDFEPSVLIQLLDFAHRKENPQRGREGSLPLLTDRMNNRRAYIRRPAGRHNVRGPCLVLNTRHAFKRLFG